MTVYAVMLAATIAPRPTATKTACAVTPTALPTTESSASRRPTVSARPIVKSRLGPGTWMKRIDATRNATHWLDVGTVPVCSPARKRAGVFRASDTSVGDHDDPLAHASHGPAARRRRGDHARGVPRLPPRHA